MDPEAAKRLNQVVLETRVDAFRRVLTGEPAADEEPLRIQLNPDASMESVRTRPRQVALEKMEWLQNQMQKLRGAGMVRFNRHVTCASFVMAVPKWQGFRIVADYRAPSPRGVSAVANVRSGGNERLFPRLASSKLADAAGRRFPGLVYSCFPSGVYTSSTGDVECCCVLSVDSGGGCPGNYTQRCMVWVDDLILGGNTQAEMIESFG